MEWEDPPPIPKPAMVYKEESDQLRERKGSWARFMTVSVEDQDSVKRLRSTGQKIRRASLHAFEPRRSFETLTRTVGEELRLYVRYVGEQPEEL